MPPSSLAGGVRDAAARSTRTSLIRRGLAGGLLVVMSMGMAVMMVVLAMLVMVMVVMVMTVLVMTMIMPW